jgi:hypothetical protein
MRHLAFTVLLAGCSGPPQAPLGRLLIEEVYYAGAVPTAGAERYYADQFVQITNASRQPVLAGGLMIGDAAGAAGEINPGMAPDSYRERRPNKVVLANVWRVPGAPEDLVLEPGASLLIAHDGTSHQPQSPLDNSGADFETYVTAADRGGDEERDDDHPLVDNLIPVHYTAGFDWLVPVFGASLVVLVPDADLEELDVGWTSYQMAPNEHVIDGVDAVMDADSAAFKRLPDAVDAGFAYVSGTYTGESIQRVRDGDELVDTNDSSNDFVVGVPDPYGP